MRDVRICAIGDSFVAGVGDPEHRGWVGRLAAGSPLTLYNLGVRRDTTRDVLARWRREIPPRLRTPDPIEGRIVVSVGVNDATAVPGHHGPSTRVDPSASAAHLENLLGELLDERWPVLVVGPPPIAEPEQTDRVADLSARYGEACANAGATWVPVIDPLRDDDVWMREVRDGDGAHPGAAGYARLAELVAPAWQDWLAEAEPSVWATSTTGARIDLEDRDAVLDLLDDDR